MWLMEEASMMSVMKGWSSIRIPVDTRGREALWAGPGFTGDKVGKGARSWMWLGGLPQVPEPWRGDPDCSLTQWGDQGFRKVHRTTHPISFHLTHPFSYVPIGRQFYTLDKGC